MMRSLVIALLITTNTLTYWWRTDDAAVISTQHPPAQCSLMMYNDKQSIIATWAAHTKTLRLERRSWHFINGQLVPILLRIGDTKISMAATGNDTFLTLPMSDAMTAALRSARIIRLTYLDTAGASEVDFQIDTKRLPQLFAAVARCRHIMR